MCDKTRHACVWFVSFTCLGLNLVYLATLTIRVARQ